MDSQTVGFDDYAIELINGNSSQQIVKVSHYGKPLMQMNRNLGHWTSELKHPDRTLERIERLLEYKLKTYNIKMDLAKDYRDRVIYKIGNVDRSILDNSYIKTTAQNIITEGMKKIDLGTYDSESIVTFNDDSIRTLTDTINQQIESERIRSIEVEKRKAVRVQTDRDLVPTAGELRTAYTSRMNTGDLEIANEIQQAGMRLNQLCPEYLKINGRAPDNYQNAEVFIEREYLQLPEQESEEELFNNEQIQSEPKSYPITVNFNNDDDELEEDYGMSM